MKNEKRQLWVVGAVCALIVVAIAGLVWLGSASPKAPTPPVSATPSNTPDVTVFGAALSSVGQASYDIRWDEFGVVSYGEGTPIPTWELVIYEELRQDDVALASRTTRTAISPPGAWDDEPTPVVEGIYTTVSGCAFGDVEVEGPVELWASLHWEATDGNVFWLQQPGAIECEGHLCLVQVLTGDWWDTCPTDPDTPTPWPPQATYTPLPTYTPALMPTCRPTHTPVPVSSPTLYPTHTPYPTATPWPVQP